MDIQTLIQDLHAEKIRLEQTIAALEALGSNGRMSRRGRKFMGAAERKQVGERMRRYWANRRKAS